MRKTKYPSSLKKFLFNTSFVVAAILICFPQIVFAEDQSRYCGATILADGTVVSPDGDIFNDVILESSPIFLDSSLNFTGGLDCSEFTGEAALTVDANVLPRFFVINLPDLTCNSTIKQVGVLVKAGGVILRGANPFDEGTVIKNCSTGIKILRNQDATNIQEMRLYNNDVGIEVIASESYFSHLTIIGSDSSKKQKGIVYTVARKGEVETSRFENLSQAVFSDRSGGRLRLRLNLFSSTKTAINIRSGNQASQIMGNKFNSAVTAINLRLVSEVEILGNTFDDTNRGIFLTKSSNNEITYNRFVNTPSEILSQEGEVCSNNTIFSNSPDLCD